MVQFTLTIDQDVASFYGQLSRFKSNLTALTQADDAVFNITAAGVVVDTRLLFAYETTAAYAITMLDSMGDAALSAYLDVNITGRTAPSLSSSFFPGPSPPFNVHYTCPRSLHPILPRRHKNGRTSI